MTIFVNIPSRLFLYIDKDPDVVDTKYISIENKSKNFKNVVYVKTFVDSGEATFTLSTFHNRHVDKSFHCDTKKNDVIPQECC